jgi:signal transduction histidine kinase
MTRHPVRFSFAFRLIASIVIIEIVMLSFLMVSNIRIINQTYLELLTTSSRDQSALLAAAVAPGLVAYDYALIEDALSVIKEKQDLLYAEVFDLDSRKVAAVGVNPQVDDFYLMGDHREFASKDVLTITRVVKVENQLVGGVRIGFSTTSLQETISHIKWNNLLISGIALMALIIATIFISILLTRKLRKLKEGVDQLQQGNLAHEISLESNDEFGDLADNVNHMARNIHRVQQQLVAEQQELENRVAQRTGELVSSNARLREAIEELDRTQAQLVETEKMASLGSIVAGVAHEINTPLGISITAASSLQESVARLNNDFQCNRMTQKAFTDHLQQGAHFCNLLTTNLASSAALINNFKQMAVDQPSTDWRTLNLFNLINEVRNSLGPALSHPQLIFQNHCEESLMIHTSPGVLYQVLSTLASNALIHAFDPDQEQRIAVEVERDEAGVIILFKDNGKGISPENIALIFEPFFTTRKGHKDRSGLGLSIIYNLISKHLNGRIKAQSIVGEGTTFIIKLPQA